MFDLASLRDRANEIHAFVTTKIGTKAQRSFVGAAFNFQNEQLAGVSNEAEHPQNDDS